LDAAMEAGWNAIVKNHTDEAESQYKAAVGFAEKLQPHDERLAMSLIRLSGVYSARKDFAHSEAMLQRALAANVELYGAESPMTTEPLQALGMLSMFESNYKAALDYFSRAVNVNEKTFGEASDKVADSLRFMAQVYVDQRQYDKAEPYLLRAVRINEALFGKDMSGTNGLPLWEICILYDKWNKPEKAEPRYREMLVSAENQFGADSPVLLTVLEGQEKALHQLGRTDEAAKVERRMQSIRATTSQADVPPAPPHP
jgi:tetratricopeptide (TPR) repeat protein